MLYVKKIFVSIIVKVLVRSIALLWGSSFSVAAILVPKYFAVRKFVKMEAAENFTLNESKSSKKVNFGLSDNNQKKAAQTVERKASLQYTPSVESPKALGIDQPANSEAERGSLVYDQYTITKVVATDDHGNNIVMELPLVDASVNVLNQLKYRIQQLEEKNIDLRSRLATAQHRSTRSSVKRFTDTIRHSITSNGECLENLDEDQNDCQKASQGRTANVDQNKVTNSNMPHGSTHYSKQKKSSVLQPQTVQSPVTTKKDGIGKKVLKLSAMLKPAGAVILPSESGRVARISNDGGTTQYVFRAHAGPKKSKDARRQSRIKQNEREKLRAIGNDKSDTEEKDQNGIEEKVQYDAEEKDQNVSIKEADNEVKQSDFDIYNIQEHQNK